jgi:cell division protein FtsN
VQAAAHLDRLVREQLPNQTGIGFARTELQVGLAYFDLQDAAHACAALLEARTAAPSTDVELRNRIDYNVQRCPPPGLVSTQPRDSTHGSGTPGVDSPAKHQASRRGAPATGTAATSKRSPPPAGQSSALSSKPSAAAPGNAAHPRNPGYTVQVAAYQTQAAAAALVEGLAHRGYVARIFGASAPFRVRVGHFATQAQADSAAQALRKKGITGFVTPGETGG